MCVSYTNGFFDMAPQGRDQFHPPDTVFLHDYVGFCAQPVRLAKKNYPILLGSCFFVQ